ncbi:MAG: hypothetical protein LBM60_09680 [Clostridium sp.]|nr:hypothetical protein [Clostridium sp.]
MTNTNSARSVPFNWKGVAINCISRVFVAIKLIIGNDAMMLSNIRHSTNLPGAL